MKKFVFVNYKIQSGIKEIFRSKQIFEQIFISENVSFTLVTFIFCSDRYLTRINKSFLKHDNLTDVITFNLSNTRVVDGEIYISIDRVKENAINYGVLYLTELRRVMIHGILHLCGYKDIKKKQKDQMTKLENYYLKYFNVPRET